MSYIFKFGNKEIKIPKLSELTWNHITEKPSTYPPSSHNHSYATWLGMNYVSGGEWFGFYNNVGGGTKLGWIGNAGTNYLIIQNDLTRNTTSGVQLRAGETAGVCLDYTTSSTNYHGYFFPRYANKVTLGTSGYRWYKLYSANASDTSSDRSLKENISYFDEAPMMVNSNSNGNIYEQIFNKLRACSFTMKSDDTNSLRFGFIAQDVLKALGDVGLSIEDVDFVSYGMHNDEDASGNPTYGLCYEEFIALNTYMIQKSISRIDSQQKEIDDLKNQVQELKNIVLKLTKDIYQ